MPLAVSSKTRRVWRSDLTRIQRGLCAACARARPLTFEHVVPKGMGGSNGQQNLIMTCQPCNSARADSPGLPPRARRVHKLVLAYLQMNSTTVGKLLPDPVVHEAA